MKRVLLVIVSLVIIVGNANATFNSGSTGADGAFNPITNTELQLPADGVFNFTTVNIPSGVTVTFAKNAANTPVHILAQGDVVINGTIYVSGGSSPNGNLPGQGGPGGYSGGYAGATDLPGGKGLGPGGGEGGPSSACPYGGGGGFGTVGGKYGTGCNGNGGPTYGNPTLMPIVGGSGGGGSANTGSNCGGGGGGGGAILIASSSAVTINGSVIAEGGARRCWDGAGCGSGGAIKVMANAIYGNGTLSAKGGCSTSGTGKGGTGRIRVEAVGNNLGGYSDPPYTYGLPGSVFPSNEPILRITSVAGVNVPANPTGSYVQPDIMLPSNTNNPVTVNISASYIPVGTTATVSTIPQYGSMNSANAILSGVFESTTGSANVNLSTQYSNVVVAQATFVMQQAMYWDGEKIDKVRVAATMGGKSEAIYITESGKEIEAEKLITAGLLIK